jgi:3-keto-disaccharide hydrolase
MRALDTLTPALWRGSQRDTFPGGSWVCEEDMLRTVAEADPMDLITRQQYRHFELTLEWRVVRGNSGILYRVTEALPHAWQSGLDMQLLDDAHHPDGQTPETSAGALYGLIAPRRPVLRPLGDFNTARIVVRASHVEQWLNGVLVVAYTLQSPALAALVTHSKFQALPGFCQAVWGHIALQHHGDPVWFRHFSLRPLPAEQTVVLPATGPA